jgi:hypothetical protein
MFASPYGTILSGWNASTGLAGGPPPVDNPGIYAGMAPLSRAPAYAPTAAELSANALSPNAGMPAGATPNTSGLGMNIGTANLALSGLNTIGGLWAAFEARKAAQQQFNYTRSVTNTNLANSIKSYNTALEDRARSRGFTEGQSQQQIDAYVAANRATRG